MTRWHFALATLALITMSGCNGSPTATTDPSDGGTTSGGDAVVVVPRSVGGGVSETESYGRDAAGAGDVVNKREAARRTVQFLNDARRRYHRALRVARRIENAPLAQLPDDVSTADFTVDTPDGETVCVRISTEPFAPEADGPVEGGAPITKALDAGDAIALRVWINRSCSGLDADYERFYASITEVLPEDVEPSDGDDSAETAWRAGRGRGWIVPGALLNVDPAYRARCSWNHTDSGNRRTVFVEQGPIAAGVVIERARYVVLREESTDDTGAAVVCKKVHATVTFATHPNLQEVDVRIGTCFRPTEEGRDVENIAIEGHFVRNDGTEVVLGQGCLRAADADVACGGVLGRVDLDLADPALVDMNRDSGEADLPELAFDAMPDAEIDLDVVDDAPVDGDTTTDGDATIDNDTATDGTDASSDAGTTTAAQADVSRPTSRRR